MPKVGECSDKKEYQGKSKKALTIIKTEGEKKEISSMKGYPTGILLLDIVLAQMMYVPTLKFCNAVL